ncbi:MAG TPA: DUF4304 domain-containing protein [Dactylosporangium sp.]|nr:DUF4304 domain-containing protein [Dactylosporangium sp.]
MRRKSLVDIVADVVGERRLRAEGFARQGRTFYLTNDSGDYALVEIQGSSRLPGMELFYVNVGVAPEPLVDRVTTVFGSKLAKHGVPGTEYGLLLERVKAPGGGPQGLGWTVSDAQSAAATGELVADLLIALPVGSLRGLVDRDRLRDEIAARNRLTPDVEAALAARDGPGERFEALLRRAAEWKTDSADFLAWARQYAARHGHG